MEAKEIVQDGRKYKAIVSEGDQVGGYLIIGPPEGLVDAMGLPEPFATKLHNILYDRGIIKYEDAVKRGVLVGVLQEAYSLDSQRLLEEYLKYEQVTI